MQIEEQDYKGKPVIVFKDEKRIYFSAGIKKVNLILENIEKLREFARNHPEKEVNS